MNIVFLDSYAMNPGDISWSTLEHLGKVQIFERTQPEELKDRVSDADIVISSKIIWNKESFAMAPRLKFISLASTGYNVIDLAEARRHKVVVSNVPSYSTPDVAQMTFALILELCLHVGKHSESVLAGKWIESADFCYWQHPLIEIADKKLGIIGMGSIGQAVAAIAEAFGMEVLFFNRHHKPELETERCHEVDLDTLLHESDFVSLHVPETNETVNMINRESLNLMKDTAFLINTARGTLVNEADLRWALDNDRIAGAAVDVVSSEPMKKDNPLLGAKNIIITPHIAWATREARIRLLDAIVANIKAFLDGSPINVVS